LQQHHLKKTTWILITAIIIGAGLSGIGAACHLSRKNPDKTYSRRNEVGGTWSLFQYPGIRPIPICTPLAIPLKLGKTKVVC
jgi:hypothetical protein